MIVADTSALIALLDRGDRHHAALYALFSADPDAWIVPWAVLPEADYLIDRHLGAKAQRAWLDDLAAGAFAVEWGRSEDVVRAERLDAQYRALDIGLVDGVVMAIAERLGAGIATLDLRHFGAVTLKHAPRLFPRDAGPPRRSRRRAS